MAGERAKCLRREVILIMEMRLEGAGRVESVETFLGDDKSSLEASPV